MASSSWKWPTPKGACILLISFGAGCEDPSTVRPEPPINDNCEDLGTCPEENEGGAGGVPTKSSSCAQFEDGEAREVLVQIVNETADVLYLGPREAACVAQPLFQVWDEFNNVLPEPIMGCPHCQDVLDARGGDCADECRPSPVVTLHPGESTEAVWSGLFTWEVLLDPACVELAEPSEELIPCLRAGHPRWGDYVFAASAARKQVCGVTGATECGPCEPREGGGCETTDALLPNVDVVATTDVFFSTADDYGLKEPISIVFRD
jgi:hypothetical protein